MPVMDGYEFLKTIKNEPSLKRFPVILLTNSPEIREIGKCLSIGAIGYLEKTGSPSDIVKKVETVFKAFISLAENNSGHPGKSYSYQTSV